MSRYSHSKYRVYCNELGEYGFIEVLYGTTQNIVAYSGFVAPFGQNIKDLEFKLEKLAEALNEPTLYDKDFLSDASRLMIKEKENV